MDEEDFQEQTFQKARARQCLSSEGSQLNTDDLRLVTGAGGFLGGHLVAEPRRRGRHRLRAVDIRPLDQRFHRFIDNQVLDLRTEEAYQVTTGWPVQLDIAHRGLRESRANLIFRLATDLDSF